LYRKEYCDPIHNSRKGHSNEVALTLTDIVKSEKMEHISRRIEVFSLAYFDPTSEAIAQNIPFNKTVGLQERLLFRDRIIAGVWQNYTEMMRP
jgi:hypothetical protein